MNLKAEELRALLAYYARKLSTVDTFDHSRDNVITHSRMKEDVARMADIAKELP